MTDSKPTPEENSFSPRYWRIVYLIVLGFLAFFCLFMYLFTVYTS